MDARAFYDQKWRQWADMERYAPAPRYLRRLVVHELARLDFDSLLDVGCGEGSLIQAIQRRFPAVHLAGCDFSARALALAETRVAAADFFPLDLLHHACTAFQWDVVTCVQVLEHLDDDALALRQIRKLCRHVVIVSVPSGPLDDHAQRNGHVRHYTLTDLIEKMSIAGFRVVRGYRCGWPVHSLYREIVRRVPASTVSAVGLGVYSPFKRVGMMLLDVACRLNVTGYGTEVIAVGVRQGGEG